VFVAICLPPRCGLRRQIAQRRVPGVGPVTGGDVMTLGNRSPEFP